MSSEKVMNLFPKILRFSLWGARGQNAKYFFAFS